MSRLEKLLSLQVSKGHEWLGSDLVQGDPRSDGALELLMKQGVPKASHLGVVNCGCGAWLSSMPQTNAVTALHLFVEDHASFVRNAERIKLASLVHSGLATTADLSALAKCDVVVFRIFRDMAANWIWIKALLAAMPAESVLNIIGKKDDGIQSIETNLGKAQIDVDSVAVGCHSRWLAIASNADGSRLPKQVADSCVAIQTPVGEISLLIPEGTFAAGHLDAGTELLLNNMGDLQNKSVWDLGCGAGVITCTALRARASRVFASDHSLLAVQTTQKNIEVDAARASASVHFLSDGVDGEFDVVLSNPPFHLEGREMRSMGSLWLAACLEHLAPNGEIRIVANSFLPYATFAKDLKLKSEIIAETKGFKVWRMVR